jgi:acyl carrier protein
VARGQVLAEIEPSPVTDADILQSVVVDALGLPPDADLSALAYGTTDTWDSVGHMQLILAVEEAFGIILDANDVVEMSSYASATRILRERHGLAIDD